MGRRAPVQQKNDSEGPRSAFPKIPIKTRVNLTVKQPTLNHRKSQDYIGFVTKCGCILKVHIGFYMLFQCGTCGTCGYIWYNFYQIEPSYHPILSLSNHPTLPHLWIVFAMPAHVCQVLAALLQLASGHAVCRPWPIHHQRHPRRPPKSAAKTRGCLQLE